MLIIGEREVPFLSEAEYKKELIRLGQQGIGTFFDDEDVMET
jgi:hypothetical protein